MVRATAAEVLKLMGGVYITGSDATNVAAILAEADYELDDYALFHYKTTLSTTDTAVISIANNLALRKVLHWIWQQAGGTLTRTAEPEIFTQTIKNRIEAHLGSTTDDGVYVGSMIDED